MTRTEWGIRVRPPQKTVTFAMPWFIWIAGGLAARAIELLGRSSGALRW